MKDAAESYSADDREPSGGIEDINGSIASRIRDLTEKDAAFRDALPSAAVNEAKLRPGLGVAQIVATVMEGYGDRPAIGYRAAKLIVDETTGRTTREILSHFATISYRELWSRARHLAAFWHGDKARPLRANDPICMIAFAGMDFATVDLAAIHNGAVLVPIQVNAAFPTQLAIVKEVEPQWIATSADYLEITVQLVLNGYRPAGILLFDYYPEVDRDREIFESAMRSLADAGMPEVLVTLSRAETHGASLPPPPVFRAPPTEARLGTIYYTSGSTGLPKGVMCSEEITKPSWLATSPFSFIMYHYLPMNHVFGRALLFQTLSAGGTCYFTARPDLSELFEDIALVRPTFLGVVPRVCEMLFQKYQVEFERRVVGHPDSDALKRELILKTRNDLLGGRLLSGVFGGASLAPELKQFMDECLGFPLTDNFGGTEMGLILQNSRIVRPPVIAYKLDDVPELGYFRTDKPYPRGEMWIKSQRVMLGYFKRPELTATVMTEDGFYKTGDIMAEIETDRLVYVDRRNNVLKLSQGEFVAIAKLEAIFTNGHVLISQVYLYGTSDRGYLLGVIVPSQDTLKQRKIAADDEQAVKAALREAIKQVAVSEQLNAYEIPRDFIIEHTRFSIENGLVGGIGKYLRPKFKDYYGPRLEQLYDTIDTTQADELAALRRDGPTGAVLDIVVRAIQATLGIERIDTTRPTSFLGLGGDSLSALSCSLLLEEIYGVDVPASVINNPAGNPLQLARYIERALDTSSMRPTFTSVHGKGATEIRAADLTLENFIDADTLRAGKAAGPATQEILTVLVTGANGFLGRFLCLEWMQRMAAVGGRVICIARGGDAAAARARIADAFDRGDEDLKRDFATLADKHLEVLAGDLSEPDLGLSQADWRRLAETVDLIVHPAALVNHMLPYQALFGPNVVGTAELIRLAITDHLKPITNISTFAVAALPDGGMMDEDADVRAATPVRRFDAAGYADGYTNSKWAGEVLLREAHDRYGLPVTVFRSDMIMPHSRYKGQINVTDMLTRWLFSIAVTGLAPRTFYSGLNDTAHYDGLPVDFSAEAIASIGGHEKSGYRSYHVINPYEDRVSQDTFVDWAIEAGYRVSRIEDYSEWFNRFETALRGLPEKRREQSSLPLIEQLRSQMPSTSGSAVSAVRFRAAVQGLAVGRANDIPHLSAPFIRKYLADLTVVGLLYEQEAPSQVRNEVGSGVQ